MSFCAAAFCPHPPLLVPAVGAGEPVAVRDAALDAARWLAGGPIQRLVILGADRRPRHFPAGSTGSFAGFGVDFEVELPVHAADGDGDGDAHGDADGDGDGDAHRDGAQLPLPLAVGAWLLAESGWEGPILALACGSDGELPPFDTGQADALLVMGDGSARRSEKAPGWLDERAADYDAAVSSALASGDPGRLGVDLALGADLLAAGAPAWSAAAGLLAGPSWAAEVSYDDAPYGVGYLVATWELAKGQARDAAAR